MRQRGSSRERGKSDVDVRCFLESFDGVLPAGRGQVALLGSRSMTEDVVVESDVVLEVWELEVDLAGGGGGRSLPEWSGSVCWGS